MSIVTTYGALLVGATLMTAITVNFSVASIVFYEDYTSDDYSGFPILLSICYVPALIILTVAAALVAFAAAGLIEFLDRPMRRRAGYFLVGFPIVLLSFIVASIDDVFVPAMIFGWPLFIMAAVLVPICTGIVKRGLDFRSWTVACWGCGQELTLRPSAPFVCCPRCGSFNGRPPTGAGGLPAPSAPVLPKGPPRNGG